jgi:hypothetical protein
VSKYGKIGDIVYGWFLRPVVTNLLIISFFEGSAWLTLENFQLSANTIKSKVKAE